MDSNKHWNGQLVMSVCHSGLYCITLFLASLYMLHTTSKGLRDKKDDQAGNVAFECRGVYGHTTLNAPDLI